MTKTTLFIPAVSGQYKLWRNTMKPLAESCDEVFIMGDIIGGTSLVSDKENNEKPNQIVLKNVVSRNAEKENWHFLMGRAEMAALNSPGEWTSETSDYILRNAWFSDDPLMKVAVAHRNRLITHGGLTWGEWVKIGSPETAEEAAARLNEKYSKTIFQGPAHNLGYAPNFSANPIWANPITEVYPSWLTAYAEPPFDQIHASTTINNQYGRHELSVNPYLSHLDRILYKTYGGIVRIGDHLFTSIHLPLSGKVLSSRVPKPYTFYVEKVRKRNNMKQNLKNINNDIQ